MAMLEICPVILAGGSGTRLWPLSRENYPKQMLRLMGDYSLFQETILRLDGLNVTRQHADAVVVNDPIIVCNEEHRSLTLGQLAGIGMSGARILLEPVGRNTAPALTIAALAVREKGTDPLLLVMPADHVVKNRDRFNASVLTGIGYAKERMVVAFGVVPTRAETGYGYIKSGTAMTARQGKAGGFAIDAFIEKPSKETAVGYLASGNYLWNSGIYLTRASVWMDAIGLYQPEILTACKKAWAHQTTDHSCVGVSRAEFEACPSNSIDYAVMERLTADWNPVPGVEVSGECGAVVVPLDAEWSDIGSWSALLELGGRDTDGNVVQGDVYCDRAQDNLLISKDRLLAAIGVRDMVIVETRDAVLVMHKDRSQDVRGVVAWLATAGRDEARSHDREYYPWGHREKLGAGKSHDIERLTVSPGAMGWREPRGYRGEHWVVVTGTAKVTSDEGERLLHEHESGHFFPKSVSRFENAGSLPLEIVVVHLG